MIMGREIRGVGGALASAFVALAACIGSEPTLTSQDSLGDDGSTSADAKADVKSTPDAHTDGTVDSCPAAQTACGSDCTNLQVDPANCGACGNVCGAGVACVDGLCSTSCPPSQTLCDADAGDAGSYCAK